MHKIAAIRWRRYLAQIENEPRAKKISGGIVPKKKTVYNVGRAPYHNI